MDPEDLERHLARDLDEVGERFTDVEFSTQLYRALANNRWTKQDELDGSIALSWSRAEGLVNELRERRGAESLVLAQTGGEGEIGDLARDVLERTGWRAEPLDTSENDSAHASQPTESPPPKGTGERLSPVDDSQGWEREAHREAEASRLGEESAPPKADSEGAGGGRNPSPKS